MIIAEVAFNTIVNELQKNKIEECMKLIENHLDDNYEYGLLSKLSNSQLNRILALLDEHQKDIGEFKKHLRSHATKRWGKDAKALLTLFENDFEELTTMAHDVVDQAQELFDEQFDDEVELEATRSATYSKAVQLAFVQRYLSALVSQLRNQESIYG